MVISFWPGLFGGLAAGAIGTLVIGMNRELMAKERARARRTLAEIRDRQDDDLAEVYRRHRHRMTAQTRAEFERELEDRT